MDKYSTDSNTKSILLKDSRILYFSEFGAVTGKPVVYFHGFPGSRLEVQRFSQIAF
ncbi:MAG: hypothetical protein KBD37_09105 [Burkholderiales bacterium]|nr:hypothetical protein [Burkholderiales bacterium]